MAQMENDHSLSELIYGIPSSSMIPDSSTSKFSSKLSSNSLFLGSSDINPISNSVKTGTTICAITYKDGVIIGADSRSSAGTYVANRLTDKLHPLTENIFILRSGSSAHTQNIGDYVTHYLNQQSQELDEPSRVKTAASLISSICYSNKNWLSASIIIAGYDKYDKGTIYSCPMGGTLAHKIPWTIGGSGSAYIYGFCDQNFKKQMTEQQGLTFIRNAISHAIFRDGSSGGVIRTCVMNKDGLKRETVMPVYDHGLEYQDI